MRPRSLWGALLLVAALAPTAFAQQRRVSGRVTGSAGEPLAAATVSVAGTRVGVMTGEDGRYTIDGAPAGQIQLLVRRLGYRPQTVQLAPTQETADVSLERDVLQLAEQVITGQATSVARQNAANDIPTVTADELTRAPSPTIENAIQGKIAGAFIEQNSGAPGGGMQVQLRGVTTINAGTGPLYVIDGVIVSNESIASNANAVTAAQAGGNRTTQDNPVNRIADINPNDIERIEVLKGASASAIYGSKAANGVIIITTKRGTTGRPQWSLTQRVGTFDLSNKIGSRTWTLDDVYEYFEPETAADTAGLRAQFGTGAQTDYEELLFGENDLSYETNLGVRGGNAATRYFVSGLVKRDAGIMSGTGYDKQSIRANLSQTFGSRFTTDVSTFYVHSLTRRGLTNNDNSGTSYYMVLPFTPSFVRLQPENGVYPNNPFERSNPIQTRDLLKNNENVYRFTGSIVSRYDLLQQDNQTLSLNLTAGIDQFNQRNDIYSPNELEFEPQDGLPGTAVRGDANVVNANATLSAVHSFTPRSGRFTATTSAGVQRDYRELNRSSIISRGLIPNALGINQGTNVTLEPDRQQTRDFAVYGQEEILALDERLLVTVGLRADRSTNNGDVDKFYFFPKASASYRFPGFSAVDELKLRAAYGQSGNPPIYGSKFTGLTPGVADGQAGVQIGLIAGDPNIRPERQTEIEAGTDVALFNGRGSLTVTGYEKRISDLILLRQVGPSSGFFQQYFNGASLRNRGVEISAAATPIQRADATWIARVLFAKNVSEITELPVPAFETGGFGTSLGAFRIEKGESATQIVGNKNLGIPNSAGEDSIIVAKLGDAAPDFQMSFSSELTWRSWRLAGLVDWKKGGDVINLTEFLYDAAGNSPDYETAGVQRISRWATGHTQEFIQDAGYVKVREISLSYEVPLALRNRLFRTARYARLELSGRNLLTFTDYRGLDPEVSNFGNQAIARNIDVAPYPPSRSFFFTIDVGF